MTVACKFWGVKRCEGDTREAFPLLVYEGARTDLVAYFILDYPLSNSSTEGKLCTGAPP
jgi:hypothetical protein